MKMKKNILSAILLSFVVYLDIVLKICFSLTNNFHAQADIYWLVLLIVITTLYYLCYFKDSLILQAISLGISFIPVIVVIIYFCTFNPLNENSDWRLVLVYSLSELMVFIPVYCLQIKKIWNMYHLKD